MPVITQTYVKRAKTRGAKYEVSCTRVKGLVLRVLPSGKKVYYFRGRVDGKDRRVRLGKIDEVSLEAARARASALAQGTPIATPDNRGHWQYTKTSSERRVGNELEERTARSKGHGAPRQGSARTYELCEGPPARIQTLPVAVDTGQVADPTSCFAGARCTDASVEAMRSDASGRPVSGEGVRVHGRIRRRPQANQRPETPRTLTIQEMASIVLRDHVEVVLKPGTRPNYRRALREINRRFGGRDLLEVRQRDVIRWHRSMAKTKSAANFKVRTLNLLYKKAQEWEYLPWERRLPTQGVKYFRVCLTERFLTPKERERLERALQEGLGKKGNQKGSLTWFNVAAIRLLSLTGMRRGEVLGLKWSYLDRVNRIVTLPESKTGKSVRPISAFTVEYLTQLEKMHRKPGCEWVIYGRNGSQLNAQALHSMWVRLRRTIGLEDVRIHDLRHSAASDALNAGVPLAVVGAILGHKSPQTTARYAHVASNVARDATDRMTAGMARIVRGVGGS